MKHLAQRIRNAYDSRDREALERALSELEDPVRVNRLPAVPLEKPATPEVPKA